MVNCDDEGWTWSTTTPRSTVTDWFYRSAALRIQEFTPVTKLQPHSDQIGAAALDFSQQQTQTTTRGSKGESNSIYVCRVCNNTVLSKNTISQGQDHLCGCIWLMPKSTIFQKGVCDKETMHTVFMMHMFVVFLETLSVAKSLQCLRVCAVNVTVTAMLHPT